MFMLAPRPRLVLLHTQLSDEVMAERAVEVLEECYCGWQRQKGLLGQEHTQTAVAQVNVATHDVRDTTCRFPNLRPLLWEVQGHQHPDKEPLDILTFVPNWKCTDQ